MDTATKTTICVCGGEATPLGRTASGTLYLCSCGKTIEKLSKKAISLAKKQAEMKARVQTETVKPVGVMKPVKPQKPKQKRVSPYYECKSCKLPRARKPYSNCWSCHKTKLAAERKEREKVEAEAYRRAVQERSKQTKVTTVQPKRETALSCTCPIRIVDGERFRSIDLDNCPQHRLFGRLEPLHARRAMNYASLEW